ncbi:MAG: hypothetical protein RL154_919 [Pseudomonadota bacterium]|jgi:hypothetical protein
MKQLLLLLFSCYSLFAATLLSLTASEESGKIDIVLSFDSQFDGSIEQTMSAKGPMLYIGEATIEAKKEIVFKSNAVKKIILSKESPSRAVLQIESDEALNIEAQKSNDNQKLEFIVTPTNAAKKAQLPYDKTKSEQFSKSFSEKFDQNRESKAESDFYWRYVVVIAFMALLLIVLIIVKKQYAGKQAALKAKAKNEHSPSSVREFSDRSQERRQGAPVPSDKIDVVDRGNERRQGADPYSDFSNSHSFDKRDREHAHHNDEELQILSQKSIDANNKLVAVEYDGDRYLLVIGPNSTIIEKTATDRRAKEFEDTFLRNDNRIEGYLKTKQLSKLDLYKARAEGE